MVNEGLKEKIALKLLQQRHPQAKTLEDGHIFSDRLVSYYLKEAINIIEEAFNSKEFEEAACGYCRESGWQEPR